MKAEDVMVEIVVTATNLRKKLVATGLKDSADEMIKKVYWDLWYSLDESGVYASRLEDLLKMKGGAK